MARRKTLACSTVELDGVIYAIVRKSRLERLCHRAGVTLDVAGTAAGPSDDLTGMAWDADRLAGRLIERRKRIGLTQVALARQAGVRVETLNRIERGKTTPDFATIRKLTVAMKKVEAAG